MEMCLSHSFDQQMLLLESVCCCPSGTCAVAETHLTIVAACHANISLLFLYQTMVIFSVLFFLEASWPTAKHWCQATLRRHLLALQASQWDAMCRCMTNILTKGNAGMLRSSQNLKYSLAQQIPGQTIQPPPPPRNTDLASDQVQGMMA